MDNLKNLVDNAKEKGNELISNAKQKGSELISNAKENIKKQIPSKEEVVEKVSDLFNPKKKDSKSTKCQEKEEKSQSEGSDDKTAEANDTDNAKTVKTDNLSDEEKSSIMLKILDWAYKKANSKIPGLGSSEEMATEYLKKNHGNVEEAVNSLIRWQTTYAGTAGFASSFGGFSTIVVTLPANIASVLAIQLRMIGAISYLAGDHLSPEEKKTASYICLLGSEAGNVLANVTSELTVKLITNALQNLSNATLMKINKAVGFRLFTKFETTGLINLGHLIPLVGGAVGASLDALSTYSVAKTAKIIFLQDIINFEKEEKIEVTKFQVLVNMALVDGKYDEAENQILLELAHNIDLSAKNKEIILDLIKNPKRSKVDLTLFKKDTMLSACLLESLNIVVLADGDYSIAEKIYMKSLIKDLGFNEEELQGLFF